MHGRAGRTDPVRRLHPSSWSGAYRSVRRAPQVAGPRGSVLHPNDVGVSGADAHAPARPCCPPHKVRLCSAGGHGEIALATAVGVRHGPVTPPCVGCGCSPSSCWAVHGFSQAVDRRCRTAHVGVTTHGRQHRSAARRTRAESVAGRRARPRGPDGRGTVASCPGSPRIARRAAGARNGGALPSPCKSRHAAGCVSRRQPWRASPCGAGTQPRLAFVATVPRSDGRAGCAVPCRAVESGGCSLIVGRV